MLEIMIFAIIVAVIHDVPQPEDTVRLALSRI